MIDLTPLLRLYAAYRTRQLAYRSPTKAQENQLRALLIRAASTKFGIEHGFSSIYSVEDYQSRVPLRSYEDMWRQYWQPVFPNLTDCAWPGRMPYFAVSSGTTSGKTKYIPYSTEMNRSNTKAGLDLLTHHLVTKPKSKIFGGKSFILGGSTDLVDEGGGILSGDLSGISAKTLPWWARSRYFPQSDLALIKNWEEKIERLSKESLNEDIRLLSGVPSWLLIFIKRLFELRPEAGGRLGNIYPNLQMIVHGGVNFAAYHKQFVQLLADSNAELREVYPASEGFIAVADRGYGEGLRLIYDHGIFFEFVPVDELESNAPTRHWIKNIEREINYAVVLTTCAGLWSYVLGDTVKFVETNPPRLLVTGRTSYFLSAFGEHLTGEEIEKAVAAAAEHISKSITDYSVGAVYPQTAGELGGHLIIVEFEESVPDDQVRIFEEELTKTLCALNDDYEAHYAKGFGLKAPRAELARKGMFAAWMKSRGKLGGQHKVPRIISDRELFQNLVKFADQFHN